jgi:hypothetical protein
MVLDAIRDVRDDLQNAAQTSAQGTERQFLDAARRVLDEAQKAAKDGKYHKAMQFVMAADVWAHIGDDIRRAGSVGSNRTGEPGR